MTTTAKHPILKLDSVLTGPTCATLSGTVRKVALYDFDRPVQSAYTQHSTLTALTRNSLTVNYLHLTASGERPPMHHKVKLAPISKMPLPVPSVQETFVFLRLRLKVLYVGVRRINCMPVRSEPI